MSSHLKLLSEDAPSTPHLTGGHYVLPPSALAATAISEHGGCCTETDEKRDESPDRFRGE